jgi:hypothetical protein
MNIFTVISKHKLIAFLSIGLLLSLTGTTVIVLKQFYSERTINQKRIKELEDALAQTLAEAKNHMQAIAKAEARGKGNEAEVNKLKNELATALQKAESQKKALEPLHKQELSETTNAQPTQQTTDYQQSAQTSEENQPTQGAEKRNKSPRELANEIREKVAIKDMLDDVLREAYKKYPEFAPNQKDSVQGGSYEDAANRGSAQSYGDSPISKGNAVSEMLSEQHKQECQKLISLEIKEAQKQCAEEIKRSVQKVLSSGPEENGAISLD